MKYTNLGNVFDGESEEAEFFGSDTKKTQGKQNPRQERCLEEEKREENSRSEGF